MLITHGACNDKFVTNQVNSITKLVLVRTHVHLRDNNDIDVNGQLLFRVRPECELGARGRRVPDGSRATPWPGVHMGAGGPQSSWNKAFNG